MASYQYVYVMQRLTKIYPGGKKVLDGITLAFLPGAKIGVLGVNGAGKSTLLRIMAGLDQDFRRGLGGPGRQGRDAAAGARARPHKDVLGNIMEGAAATKALLIASTRSRKIRRPGCRHGRADGRAGRAAGADRRRQRLGAAAHARHRDGRAALPAGRSGREHAPGGERAGSRSAGCCCSGPTCCCSTSPPTTWTPNRSPGSSAFCRSTRAPSWRSRTIATSSTTSPAGSSSSIAATASRGRATTRPGSSRSRSGWPRRNARRRPASARSSASWSGSGGARGPPGQEQGPHHRVRGPARAGAGAGAGHAQIMIPPGPRLGDLVVEARHAQGLWRSPADRRPELPLPPGGIVGVIGANGAGKTTLFRMITGQEQPDSGSLRIGDDGGAGLRRSEPRGARAEQVGVGGDFRRRRSDPARQARGQQPRLRVRLQFPRPRPAEEGGRCPAASATACTSPSC